MLALYMNKIFLSVEYQKNTIFLENNAKTSNHFRFHFLIFRPFLFLFFDNYFY